MKTEHPQVNPTESPLNGAEIIELDQLTHDSTVQTYLRLQESITHPSTAALPGVDLVAVQQTQSAIIAKEIQKLLQQDSNVAVKAERFLSLNRRNTST